MLRMSLLMGLIRADVDRGDDNVLDRRSWKPVSTLSISVNNLLGCLVGNLTASQGPSLPGNGGDGELRTVGAGAR